MILERMRTIRGGARLYLRKKYKQCVENGYISCRRKDVNNAMRRAPLCMEKMVKAICDGIVPLYVGDLRRRKALSHVLKIMKVIQ